MNTGQIMEKSNSVKKVLVLEELGNDRWSREKRWNGFRGQRNLCVERIIFNEIWKKKQNGSKTETKIISLLMNPDTPIHRSDDENRIMKVVMLMPTTTHVVKATLDQVLNDLVCA
jgi:hypothetical protein